MTATDIIAAAQPIIVALLGWWKWQHAAEMRERLSTEKERQKFWTRLADQLDRNNQALQTMSESIIRMQERFDTHAKESIHNFNQVRSALAGRGCSLDETQATEVHDAANHILRTRTA